MLEKGETIQGQAGTSVSGETLSTAETGWLADLTYTGGKFEAGLAMFFASDGAITRFSRDERDFVDCRRLPNRAILPGLVNVHSHSFHRVISGRTAPRCVSHRATY